MDQLYPLFKDHIQKSRLIRAKDEIIVAFSGGKDSTALLLLLQRLSEDIPISLRAAYYNHQIRTDYKKEESWVQGFCRERGIPLEISRKNVRDFARRNKLNLEKAAAVSRYEFFRQLAKKNQNVKIATAHTRSDLCETYFIKLFRGSGLEGLASIYEIHDTRIIRPVLIFSQETILDFLNRNKIGFYQDHSNDDASFLRNNLRKNLIPKIKTIEPRIEKHIYHNVEIIKAELAYFKEQAAKFLKNHLILGQILPIEPLADLLLALQRHVLREYLRRTKGDLQSIDFKHIDLILSRIDYTAGLAVPGIELIFKKGFIYPRQLSIDSYCYSIEKDTGSTYIEEIEKTIRLSRTHKYQKPGDNFTIILPLEKVQFPLIIRSPEKPDQYLKINATHSQRVFEAIRVSGYPDRLRNLCPVVIDGEEKMVWVAGSPVADSHKVEDTGGKDFLKIEYM